MPVAPLTLRLVKGSPLTIEESDNNLAALRDAHDALEARLEATINADGTLFASSIFYAASTAGVDDYEITVAPVPSSLADLEGKIILMLADVANDDGDATVAVNGLTATAITKTGAVALDAADIKANQIVQLVYDGTRFQKIG